MSLALCTSCRRHVRVDEPHCPFCGGSIGQPVLRAVSRARRAAILFGSAAVIAGCGSTDDTSVVAMYGMPIEDSATLDTGSTKDSAQSDTSAIDTAVGDTAVGDTAVADTAKADAADAAAADTAETDTGGAVPPYGAPFIDDSGSD